MPKKLDMDEYLRNLRAKREEEEAQQTSPPPASLPPPPSSPLSDAGARRRTVPLSDALVEEFAKRHKAQLSLASYETKVLAALASRRAQHMPSQLAVLDDPSPRVAAICTRRAGKTHVCIQLLLEAAQKYPGAIVQYIAMTRSKAHDLMYRKLKIVCDELGIDAHWDDQMLRTAFANGAIIRCGGANDRDEIEKYRGDAYPLVVIDEAASFGPRMEALVLAAIEPALMDYCGKLVMVGSPGEAQAGYFYEIYKGLRPQWSVHKWSFLQNEFLPAEVRTEEYIKRSTGLPLDSPLVQREYFGNWVADTNSLVYRFDETRNLFHGELDKHHDWQHIMGIDLGFHDPTAFVIAAWARTYPCLFIVEAAAFPHLLPSDIAAKIQAYKDRYRSIMRIICDTGGSMARSNVEEWNRRWGFGIVGAQKTEKLTYIEHFNSELVLGRIKVRSGNPIIEEWKELVWEAPDPDSVRTDYRRREHQGFANHLSDACLYAFRESIHWLSRSPNPDPTPGTIEALNKQALDAKLKAFKATQKSRKFNYGKLHG